jgi:hypothetical protein
MCIACGKLWIVVDNPVTLIKLIIFIALAGYSGTPLIKKSGIKPEMKVLLLGAPDNYFTLLDYDVSQQIITAK